MLQTFKIINALDDVDYRTWFTKVEEQHQITRRAVSISADGIVSGADNVMKPKSRLDIRKHFFSCRVVDYWNNLPDHVKKSGSVNDFKTNYDNYMAGK